MKEPSLWNTLTSTVVSFIPLFPKKQWRRHHQYILALIMDNSDPQISVLKHCFIRNSRMSIKQIYTTIHIKVLEPFNGVCLLIKYSVVNVLLLVHGKNFKHLSSLSSQLFAFLVSPGLDWYFSRTIEFMLIPVLGTFSDVHMQRVLCNLC